MTTKTTSTTAKIMKTEKNGEENTAPLLLMCRERHKGDRSVEASKEIALHMQAFHRDDLPYVHTHITHTHGVHNHYLHILDFIRLVFFASLRLSLFIVKFIFSSKV